LDIAGNTPPSGTLGRRDVPAQSPRPR